VRRRPKYAKLTANRVPRATEDKKAMRLHVLAALLVAPLCACSFGPGGTWATPQEPAATGVAVVETPVYLAYKLPVCLLRTPLLLPATLASSVVPFSKSKEGTGGAYLSNNAQSDCGPPYTVTPNEVATEP
jgi:hypothetical protein